ncbi:hypothetical protein ACW2QC_01080 [Virgibacillus sp. FSP13]
MKKWEGKYRIITLLIFLLFLLLFQKFVWNEYIVNPTASDALEKGEGKQGFLTEIDKKQSLGILETEDGYHAYALSQGFWGWSITGGVYIQNASSKENFVTKKETFEFKDNKEADVILITTKDDSISYFLAFDENGNEIHFDTTRDEGKELHYAYSESPLSGKITFEAYSSDDELLYRK